MFRIFVPTVVLAIGAILAAPAGAAVIYNNLTPNNQIGIATRPGAGTFEIEAADDFILTGAGVINSAAFTGLLVPPPTGGSVSITDVVIEIYRVFPADSDTNRTPNVVTRANSPSDVAFDSRESGTSLTFSTSVVLSTFTALNSVAPGGIHPAPNQTTGGNGPITGQEVQINVNFTTPFTLPADHYFFVPEVELSNGGVFYWLSASRPITGPGTTPFTPDLQAWTRDQFLDPDWSRVGTDIVGGTNAPQFNLAFSLDGTVAPEPSGIVMVVTGLMLAGFGKWRFAAKR
ncbi:MAG TPA: hypothetical protein VNV86_22510 [Candidatus Acidoferrum sp.]|nr:hypothetical protein [Candidatus Acidoferrum sp.]